MGRAGASNVRQTESRSFSQNGVCGREHHLVREGTCFTKRWPAPAVRFIPTMSLRARGQGASERGKTDYVSRIRTWANGTFGAALAVVNGAVPATPSTYFALCNQAHVPAEADIVVVELNINDGPQPGGPHRRAHERLLRKLLQYKNRPAVLEMVFYLYPGHFAPGVVPRHWVWE